MPILAQSNFSFLFMSIFVKHINNSMCIQFSLSNYASISGIYVEHKEIKSQKYVKNSSFPPVFSLFLTGNYIGRFSYHFICQNNLMHSLQLKLNQVISLSRYHLSYKQYKRGNIWATMALNATSLPCYQKKSIFHEQASSIQKMNNPCKDEKDNFMHQNTYVHLSG